MSNILEGVCLLAILIVFIVIGIYLILIKDSSTVQSSKCILNKFELDSDTPEITEMIKFYKNEKNLNKYNIE